MQVLSVMVMGAFISGIRRKYLIYEYISAVFLVIGLILFTLADAHTSPNFSMAGVVMVSGALVMDSFFGNLQETIVTMNLETSQMEMVFFSTVVGLPFLIPPMILTGISSGLGVPARRNVIHGSYSIESARKEIALWFPDGIVEWQSNLYSWIYDKTCCFCYPHLIS